MQVHYPLLWANLIKRSNYVREWAAVVAQLVERLLPRPEVRGSNPVIGEILFMCSLSTVLKRR